MRDIAGLRIDIEAAKALIDWKSRFAADVAERARALAAQSGKQRVTLGHYRQAARHAVQDLSATILDEGQTGGDHEAA